MNKQRQYSFMIMCLVGTVLNVFEIALICKGGQHRIPFQMAVLSLAVADLLTCLPVSITNALFVLFGFDYSDIPIDVYSKSIIFAIISSQLHVMFIATQRLIAVMFPLSCKLIVTSFRCRILLGLFWIVSLSIAALLENYLYAIYISTLACAVIIGFTYAFIVHRVRNRSVVGASNAASSASSNITSYSVVLFLLFVVCHFPLLSVLIIYNMKKSRNSPWVATYYLFLLNSITNPLVYFLFKVFKHGVFICCKRKEATVSIENPRSR